MKQILKYAIFFLSCMFFASTLHAVTWNPDGAILLAKKDKHKHKHKQKKKKKKKHKTKTVTHVYHYYPSAHVYFNPVQKLYFYLVGTHWKSAATLPSTIVITPGDHVVLNLNTDKPYLNYKTHKIKYARERAYKFYPTLNVYFDPSDKVWFYLDGSSWITVKTLPNHIHISNHNPVVIELDTLKPYKYYDVHKVKYNPKNKHKHKK